MPEEGTRHAVPGEDEGERRADEAAWRDARFLDSIIENIPDMIFVKDAEELRFVRFNRAGEELLGYPREVLIGRNDFDFFPREEAEFFTSKDREVLRAGRLVDIPEEPIQTRHRGERTLHTKKIPILDDTGRPRYLLGISEDITERKRAEAALIRARREAEALASIARDLATAFRCDDLLERIADHARTLTGSDIGFIAVRSAPDQPFAVVATAGARSRLLLGLEVSLEASLGGQALASGCPATTDDYLTDPSLHGRMASVVEAEGIVAMAVIPVSVGQEPVALLYVAQRSARSYAPADLDLLSRLADHAAVALHNAQLHRSLDARLERLQTLTRLNQLVSGSLDLDTVLAAIATAAAALFRGVVASFWLADADRSALELRAVSPEPLRQEYLRTRLAFGEGAVGWVAARQQPLTVEEIAHDSRFVGADWMRRFGLRAFHALPIVLEGDLLAVLTLMGRHPFRFDEVDGRLLDSFVAQAAVAIRNAARYQAIERARAETRAILDAAGEAMVLIAPDGSVATLNRAAAEGFGLDPAAVVGRHVSALRPQIERIFGDAAPTTEALLAMVRDHRNRQFRQVVTQQAPTRRELELFSTPVRDAAGLLLGRLFVFRDVTREREVDRMKTEFVSLVSHELRTPLTSIKGYVDLLVEGEVGQISAEQREFLEIVRSNADRLVALINDLLDISRIEAGKVELELAPVDLCRTIRDVAGLLRPGFEAKEQRLTLDLPDTDGHAAPPPVVMGDADRLAQVVTNLLSNAHKYTPAGGAITVTLHLLADRVRVEVSDTGIGLTPQEQAQLFTKFYRARNRASEEVPGTGLGLPITRSLVELHGGEIGVVSEPGRGSTFWFSLPLTPGRAATTPGAPVPSTSALPRAVPESASGRILVVDDEPNIAHLIRRYLERAGYEVLEAHSAAEAFSLARHERPDLITLDVLLPDADGFTALEWLKRDSATSAIPVVLLSVTEDSGQGRLLGAVDYLTKPVREAELVARIRRLLRRAGPVRILVADDDPDVRAVLGAILRRQGYAVIEAASGREAIERVRACVDPHSAPAGDLSLLLLDVKMPDLDGVEALRALREDPRTRDIPAIMMTGDWTAFEANRSAIEALGADLLLKPTSIEALAETIRRGLAGSPR